MTANASAHRGTLTYLELLHGRDELPETATTLVAGPLTAELHGVDLRYIRLDGVELVRRIYAAVRDEDWGTPPPRVSDLEVASSDDAFRVRFSARHDVGELAFSWRGEIEGRADGTITYSMDGSAERAFRFCRIGINVLHPPADCAGAAFRAEGPDGVLDGELPETVGPQRFEDGQFLPLFAPFSRLELSQRGGSQVRFAFDGALFEVEDQRNWTDASFKTYSPPLALGYPFSATAGERISQSVIMVAGASPAPRRHARRLDTPEIAVLEPLGRPLPPVGLGTGSHGDALSQREATLLRALRPAHLRADVDPGAAGWAAALDRAARAAETLECGLELALLLDDDIGPRLRDVAQRWPVGLVPTRLLVFHAREETTSADTLRSVRRALAEHLRAVPVVGGTNVGFAELNRTRPDLDAIDGVAYPITPQVHAFDELSLIETLEAQADTLISARTFCGERPLHVSPVTLRPRFNADASGPEPTPGPGELPFAVDRRQASMFAAAWTVGSLRAMSGAGAAAITYFETTGWRGVMETEHGSAARFPSRPEQVFPVYHVLADACALRGAELVGTRCAAPLDAQALVVRHGGGRRVALVANLKPAERSIRLTGLETAAATVRVLDGPAAGRAAFEPERLRAEETAASVRDGRLALELGPYGVARVEWGA